MEKKQKVILYLILILLVLIISIVIVLLLQNKRVGNNMEDIQEESTQDSEDYENFYKENLYNKKLSHIQVMNEYFTIKSIVKNYINSAAFSLSDELINILSEDYIDQYKININNVIEKSNIERIDITNVNASVIYYVDTMLQAEQNDNINTYIVKGKYRFSNSLKYHSINTIVIIDKNNKLYNIYPNDYVVNNKYDELKSGDQLNISIRNMTPKNSKSFEYLQKSEIDMINEYFNNWYEFIYYDKENAYNKLNSEFKAKKYNSLKTFQNYLSNLGYIPRINEYRTYSTKDYTDYICTDQYNNYYIFRQQGGIMRYTVFLDSYTVELDTFKQNYENAEDNTKLAIQIGKFKQMLNSKDYNAIYSKLNETFKKNNFSSVSKLEQYLKSNSYEINAIEIEEISKNEDYYICKCVLINRKNENERKNMTIVIKLMNSNNFEMSFNIK